MRPRLSVASFILLLCLPTRAAAAGPRAPHGEVRHKTGPATLRGIATHVRSGAFVLHTTRHGSYSVNAAPPTHVVERGRAGRVVVVEGNHVGVRGYVQGRTIRAIQVRIYPVKPKPVSIRGTISAIAAGHVQVQTGHSLLTVVVTRGTVIRTSSATLATTALHVGDRILARIIPAGGSNTALRIHVYRSPIPARHVKLSGSVATTNGESLVVRASGTSYTVSLTPRTRFYAGASHTSVRLKAGDSVTIYACCAGKALSASSVHVHVASSSAQMTELRGTIVQLSTDRLRLGTPHAPEVRLQAATMYEVGATPTTRSGVRVGDAVSVRGQMSGATLRAVRVHVYASSRKAVTVRGRVSGVSSNSILVRARGATYTVRIEHGITLRLEGRSARLSDIRLGDRVRGTGHVSGHTLQASNLDVTRPAPKTITLRGSLTSVGATWLVVTRSSGTRTTVRVTSHTSLLFEGKRSALTAFFVGVHVVTRGVRSGSEILASSVTAQPKPTSATGRVTGKGGSTVLLQPSVGAPVQIDLPTGVVVRDGARPVSLQQIGRGAYVTVNGYKESAKTVRAVAVAVLHPTVDVRGSLVWQGHVALVQTKQGESLVALFDQHTKVGATRPVGKLRPSDLPGGTSVHALGRIDISGALLVRTLTVRLHSTAVRAKLESVNAGGMVLDVAPTKLQVRVLAGTTFLQGSRALTASDLVPGDDLTVYGYALSGNAIVARKVSVHRRLMGLEGIVASVQDQTFVLTAADGPHTVLVRADTVVLGPTGTVLAAAMKVHVTGYLRGDGGIIATRVRILKIP